MTRESKSWPNEIIDKIFQHLPSDSLKECRKVCRLWNSNATRHFMNQVVFHNQNEIFRFLDCQPIMTSAVKKMKIDRKRSSSDNVSKENIEKLMMSLPNLQELVLESNLLSLNHLNSIELPTHLTSVTVSVSFLSTIQDVHEFIEILTKIRGTLQKFNMVIDIEHGHYYNSWDMINFFASFSKLIELDVERMFNIKCLADCLPIIQVIPSLKSIDFCSMHDIDPDLNNTIQYKNRLKTLEKLKITANEFLPHTVSFIISNFTGLKEFGATFYGCIINNLHNSAVLLEFLDYLVLIDTYNVRFSICHKLYLLYLSDPISSTFTQIPENNQNSTKILHLTTLDFYHRGTDMYHCFNLNSYRDVYNRLQSQIMWNIQYNTFNIDEILKWIASFDKINLDVFIFDMSYIPLIRFFDIFFKVLSLLIDPKSVILRVSKESRWPKHMPPNQINHIAQLEIQIIDNSREDNLTPNLDIFPNLKNLRFIYYCGSWQPESNIYLLELPLLSLETLQLDVTLLSQKAKDFGSEKFILKIETNSSLHLYEVSIDSLQVMKLKQVKPDINSCIQLCIKIQNIQKFYLQLMNGTSELKSMITSSTFSPPCMKETLILL